jgi:Spy/CpxP family protein refolding chaperone
VKTLTNDLNLTPDQAKQLDDAIREAQARFRAIREGSQPQIDATRAQAREKVRSFLTPEQRPKYEDYLRKLDEERRRNGQP